MSKKKVSNIFRRRDRVVKVFTNKVITEQHHARDLDINTIVERARRGDTRGLTKRIASNYGDFSDPISYEQSLNMVIKAQADFDSLPAKIRERFDNDPYKLLQFLNESENKEEAIRLGIVNAPVPEQGGAKKEDGVVAPPVEPDAE